MVSRLLYLFYQIVLTYRSVRMMQSFYKVPNQIKRIPKQQTIKDHILGRLFFIVNSPVLFSVQY